MKKNGVYLRSVGIILFAITLVWIFAVIRMMFDCSQKFKLVEDVTDQYIICESAAKDLQDGSDYLTEQVRLFADTGKPEYMRNYFIEANETKRRNRAVASLEKYFSGTDTLAGLKSAMDQSLYLMGSEFHSMKLICEAYGYITDIPEEVGEYVLYPHELSMTAEEKTEFARTLVTDNNYQNTKNAIISGTSGCMNSLIDTTRREQENAEKEFSAALGLVNRLILLAGLLVLLSVIFILIYVVYPLKEFEKRMEENSLFPVKGSAEIRKLAVTYNRLYEENKRNHRLLRHEAEHDALTGLLNRGSFEQLLKLHETEKPPFALIMFDVDNFKDFNDTYGHEVGDSVLKKVANAVKNSFRSIDYTFRIGGDEFALIMVEMTEKYEYVIIRKLEMIQQLLSDTSDGLPAITLSIGAAFSSRENPGDSLFKDTDKALYYVKEHGRNGYSFYPFKQT